MLSDLVAAVTQFVENLVVAFGSPGITLVALFENLFPPTPSEFLYPLAGKLVYDGRLTLLEVVLAGVIGSLIGSLLFYSLGYRLGAERTREVIERAGTLRLGRFRLTIISVDEYERAMKLFERRGGFIVFLARLLPLVHGVVSIPAGVVRMNLAAFVFFTVLGAAGWITPLALLGYWLGGSWQQVLYWMDLYQNVIYVLAALMLCYYVYRRLRACWLRAV